MAGGIYIVTLLPIFLLAAKASMTTPACNDSTSIKLSTVEVYENGSAWDAEEQELYLEGTYWKDEDSNTYYGCPCKLGRPCLRKCCPIDQAMNLTSKECFTYDASRPWFRPNVSVERDDELSTVDGEERFELFYREGCVDGEKMIDPKNNTDRDYFILTYDGYLSMPQQNSSNVAPGDFCLGYFPEIDSYYPFLCNEGHPHEQPICVTIVYILFPTGMVISIFFLGVSFFVYTFLPDLRNLHGKCLLCHIGSLQSAYVFLVLIQVLGNYMNDEVCYASGFIAYFSFLSTFFWLNIMCIDMSIAFSGLRAMTGSAQERDRKKFTLYMLYAWGVPLIMLAISLVMEFGPVPDGFLKPEFKKDCWFMSNLSRVAYFIGPAAVILTVNIGLFLFTAIKIFKLKKETKMLKKGDSRRHKENDDNKRRFNLYLKLFIVMGVSWALEIISWAVGGSECIWIPADLFNTLQGVFIFLIFVWKDKIRRRIVNKLCPRLALKLKMHRKKGSSSSDGRSICTVSSTIPEGDTIKLSAGVATSPDTSKIT